MTVVLDAPQPPATLRSGQAPRPRSWDSGTCSGSALRPRDRVRIVLWVGGLVAVVVATVESISGLYSTPAELEQYARIVQAGNTALIVQAGPGYGLDDPTLGAVMMNELSVWVTIAVAADERLRRRSPHPHRGVDRERRTHPRLPGRAVPPEAAGGTALPR